MTNGFPACTRARLSAGVVGVLALGLLAGCAQSPAVTSQTDPLAINLVDVSWGPPGGGNGVPLGTRTARQGVDPASGGITYYAEFPAGTHFDLHWHTFDEFVSVLQGPVVLELGGVMHTLDAGAYVVIPGSMHHSWDVPPAGDAIILVRRAGPADFHFVTD